MASFETDPINSAIYNGMKRGIELLLEQRCYGPALILIYSGIDSMAFLSMPKSQQNVGSKDFVDWCNKYIRFPCKEQVTGLELYSARCGVVHSYGVESNLTRTGKCRMIGYADRSIPEIVYDPTLKDDLVQVSIHALAEAFFSGIDNFLVDSFTDAGKISVLEVRLRKLLVEFPVKRKGDEHSNPI